MNSPSLSLFVSTLTAGSMLYRLRRTYPELAARNLAKIPAMLGSIAIGLLVVALWIKMVCGRSL